MRFCGDAGCGDMVHVHRYLAASAIALDDRTVAERMVREAGVASIPISAFYAVRAKRGFLRLCFAKENATLDRALEKLAVFRRQA